MRMRRSCFVVSARMTGGCTIGTSAMYEYAATMIGPRYCEFRKFATKMLVGPSAAPMTAMDAASRMSKPSSAAIANVKKMPNCAAAPNSMSFGFCSSGSKSIIAPMPMNSSSGNSSLAMPAPNRMSSAPASATPSYTCVTAPDIGRFTRIAPKPIGSSSAGSISFLIAR